MSIASVKKEDIEQVMRNLKAGEINAMAEIPTGFSCLDLMFGGFRRGQMVVIAGHPGIGTTAFAINIVEHLCVNNNMPVAYFSMQLSREQWIKRFLLSFSRVHPFKARYGRLDDNELENIDGAGKMFVGKPLYIDDTPRLTPAELKGRVREINKTQRQAVRCVFIDCLQLMDTEAYCAAIRQKTAEISEGLKSLACDMEVAVVVLCGLELKYENELGFEKQRGPKINDLGENIIVDRYVDMMMLLNRDDYYCRADADYEPNGNAEVIITRNRNGPTGVFMLRFQKDTLRFEDLKFHE